MPADLIEPQRDPERRLPFSDRLGVLGHVKGCARQGAPASPPLTRPPPLRGIRRYWVRRS